MLHLVLFFASGKLWCDLVLLGVLLPPILRENSKIPLESSQDCQLLVCIFLSWMGREASQKDLVITLHWKKRHSRFTLWQKMMKHPYFSTFVMLWGNNLGGWGACERSDKSIDNSWIEGRAIENSGKRPSLISSAVMVMAGELYFQYFATWITALPHTLRQGT